METYFCKFLEEGNEECQLHFVQKYRAYCQESTIANFQSSVIIYRLQEEDK